MADQTNYDDLIKQQYQQSLGRDPTAAELASDTENAQKYGWNSGPQGGVQATIANRATNTPNSGSSSQATPTQQWSSAPVPVNTQNPDPRATDLYNTLLSRSNQSLSVGANDPTIRAQTDAYSAAQDRSSRDYLSNLAEKAGPYANLRGETRLASEQAGQNTAGFQAQLMGNELEARRTEIQNALMQMGGILSKDQSTALQAELANLDAALKRQGLALQGQQIGNQNSQFYANLGQGQDQFLRQLALNQWIAGDNSNLNWAQL